MSKIKKQLIGTEGFIRCEQEIENHKVSYLVRNEKKKAKNTFVLCHGAACTSFTMQPLANELANKFPSDRVIVIDVPWHGESTSTESVEGKNINDYSAIVNEFILALIKEKKIEGKFTWLGWSMGGSLGLLAETNDVPIDNLVLLCSSPYWETLSLLTDATPSLLDKDASSDTWEAVILTEVADTGEKVLNVYKENIGLMLSKPEVAVNDLKALAPEHYDVRTVLPEVSANTFIFGGSQDLLANVELQQLFDSEIPNSRLRIFDDVHALTLKPKRVEAIVKDLKKNLNSRRN